MYGYYSHIDSSSAEVAPFLSKSIRPEKSNANVSEPQPVVLEKQKNKRSTCQTQEDVTNAQKKSRMSRTAGPFKCTVQADPLPAKPEWCRLTHPVHCMAHKEPEMKKFVATALTVVAPSVDKSLKVSDSKKRSAKEDVKSDILVKSPAKSHQQKSIADIRKEDPKIKLKCNVGGKSLPTTQICVSCKIIPPSNLSIFYFTEHSILCIL